MTAPIGLVGKLKAAAVGMLQQALDDWAKMTGLVVESLDAKVQNMPRRAQLETAVTGGVVLIETRVEGRCEGPYFFVFPNALAAVAVGKLVLLPAEAVASKSVSGMDASDIEAFKELANILCGSSNNVLARTQPGLRLSQSVAHLKIWPAMPDLRSQIANIPDAEIACISCSVRVESRDATIYQIMPLALARSMFA